MMVSFTSFSQTLTKTYSEKIHPFFQQEIERVNRNHSPLTNGMITVTSNKQGEKIYSAIIKIDDENKILSSSMSINSVIPGYATARITLSEMDELSKKDYISYIYPGEIMYPTNNVAGGLTGANIVRTGYINSTTYDGSDVIVLVIDTGIDWSHEDFQNSGSPNTSRILYIWDQTLIKTGTEKTPEDRDGTNFSGLDYGVEYTQADINDEIDGTPASFVREKDISGHGTHVTGSAAGNGNSSSGNYSGMAPKADIVFVKAGNGSFPSSNLIDALNYAKKISETEGKPVVVNMSLGGHSNAHDGTRDLDIAVDNFTSSGNGRVAVVSAGNEGGSSIHITGSVASSASSNVTINIPSYTANSGTEDDYFYLDLWWNNSDNVDVTVTSPNGYTHSQTSNSQGTGSTADGAIYIFNYVDAGFTNGDRRNYFKIYDVTSSNPPAQGNWTFALTNSSSSTMTYHAWLFSSSMGASLTGGDTDYTVGSPGVATSAITVGAYVSRWKWHASDGGNYSYAGTDYSDDIASFSSIGPTRDGRIKPDITAPGEAIISCSSGDATFSAGDKIDSYYHKNQGTSMSSPVAAGCVALMLDYDASLTAAQVKSYMVGSTETDSYTGSSLPNYVWGYGKLNVFNAISNIYTSSTTNFNDLYFYDSWSSDGSASFGSGTKIAVKFTPSSSGDVTGALFHPSTTVDLTGPMYFEIWSDDGSGLPSAKLGTTVSYDNTKILKYSWNYVDLSGSGVSVTSGSDYHIVMYYSSGTGFYIRMDNGAIDGRSSYNTGSGWSAYSSGDFRIRAIVSTAQSTVPVELTSFTATTKNNSVMLNWETATEVNNYGFEIQRLVASSKISEFETIGFVEGHGNSNTQNNYSFIDNSAEGKNLNYRLKQINTDGSFEYSNIVEISLNKVYKYSMEQNNPNPFNPSTAINYTIPTDSKVKIEIFNSLGQKVTELLNKNQATGKHSVTWNAINFSSGTYFARLSATSLKNNQVFTEIKKLLLIK
jgi:subtilisin family serine protease